MNNLYLKTQNYILVWNESIFAKLSVSGKIWILNNFRYEISYTDIQSDSWIKKKTAKKKVIYTMQYPNTTRISIK